MTKSKTNPPQHGFGEADTPTLPAEKARQTGVGTSTPDTDVADPHPSDEGDPYDERRKKSGPVAG